MSSPNLNVPGKVEVSYRVPPTETDTTSEYSYEQSDYDKLHHQEREKLVEIGHTDNKGESLTKNTEVVIIPPDGGWGWVIVLASFMCNLIVDGIIFSFGTFLMCIATEFSVTKGEVTLVGSLMSGFYLMAGPFASAIANAHGFRLVAIFGSVLGAAGFALSNFATNLTFLCITYGVIGGIGFGFIYVPSIISIGFYFERWRALATGIAVCGSGVGTFLFAPLSEFLITHLGWRAALLCQGGLVFSCVIYGFLFRPLKPIAVEEAAIDDVKSELILDTEAAIGKYERNSLGSFPDHQSSILRSLTSNNNNSKFPRLLNGYHTLSIPNILKQEYVREKTLSVPFLANHDDHPKEKIIANNLNKPLTLQRKRTLSEGREEQDILGPLGRKDIFFSGSLKRLSQYTSKSSLAYNMSVMKLSSKPNLEEEVKNPCKLCPESIRNFVGSVLDLSLMKSPSFLILAFGGFFTMMGFYVPYMYLVDRATDSGMDKITAVWLISSIGISNTIGRVLCGIISSFPKVNALFLTNLALTVGGLSTMLSGLSLGAEYQFFYTVVFGLSISCFASLRSIVVVDLLGLENLTNAFGLLLLFQGVAAIIGAPLAGAFMNATGSYDACFYLSGGVLTLSAVMCYPLNRINKWERTRNVSSSESAT